MGNYWSERNLPYKPGQKTAFKISRSKIELFKQCPRCFWLDTRLKIKRPSSPPFRINSAIDELLKKEFDTYRQKQQPHPLMTDNQVKAIPMQHADLDQWRHNFTGITTIHQPTNLHIFGAIDDLWVNDAGELIVVDYKATAKAGEVGIDAEWQISYKRQLEVYQWLLRQNGFTVSDTGYFVYTNGRLDPEGFFDRVEFRTKVIPYTGNADWVDGTIQEIKDCLEGDMPAVGKDIMDSRKSCEYCSYAKARTELTLKHVAATKSTAK